MTTDQTTEVDFETPRPTWATHTDTSSMEADTGAPICSHAREFMAGLPVWLEIRQEDILRDGVIVYGKPQLVGFDSTEPMTPQVLARIGQQCLAAAESYARISGQ